MSDESTAERRDGSRDPVRRPDHAARRMLVTTVAITAVVAIGVFAWSLVRGDDEGGTSAATGWDRVAVVDRTTGAVTTYDTDGSRLDRATGSGRVTDVHVHGDRIALVGTSGITLASLDDGGGAPTTVPVPPGSTITPIETADTLHLLVGDPAGGNLLIVDVDDGSVLDVGALAAPTVPKLFVETVRVDPDGTTFAVADAANFQTIVVQEEVDGAVFLADQPVAVGEELVATSQVVNLQADIALVDLERRNEALVPTELPRGGVMVGDDLVMVSVDGGVFRIRPGSDQAEAIGEVDVPTGATVEWVAPTYLGERLIAGGSTFEAVLDLDGGVLFTTTFTTTTHAIRPRIGWRCLPVGGAADGHSLVDLGTGEQLADLTGSTVTSVSADGCSVVAERAGALELVDRDGSIRLGVLREASVAPDGRTVVWTTTTGRTELVTVDDGQLGTPTELVGAPTNLSVHFLQD